MMEIKIDYKRALKLVFSLALLFIVTACQEDACTFADDWGYPKQFVPAGPSGDAGPKIVNLSGGKQAMDWTDSGQVIVDSSQNLLITTSVRSKWLPWYGVKGNEAQGRWSDQQFVSPNKVCAYRLHNPDNKYDIWPEVLKGQAEDKRNTQKPDKNLDYWTPCWLKDGMGLYIGLANDNSTDQSNIVTTKHIADAKKANITKIGDWPYLKSNDKHRIDFNSDLYSAAKPEDVYKTFRSDTEMDGYLVRGPANSEIKGAQTNDRIFFKIMDNYYDDNIGGYEVHMKSGTRSPEPGPLEAIVQMIKDPLYSVMTRTYEGIVNNKGFVDAVRAAIALFIIFYGFSFMMGMVEGGYNDFLVNIFRVGVVIALISPGSWDFFYNYLFDIFVRGIEQVTALVMSPFGDYDPNQPWFSMDRLLAKFFSAETSNKISAVLFSNAIGFLFIVVIYAVFILFLVSLVKALMVYLIAVMGVAMLIAIAPLFIVFIMFSKTKPLFDEWIQQFVAHATELLILMAALGLFAAIIVQYMESTLGFRTCWEKFYVFELFGHKIFSIGYWMPSVGGNEHSDLFRDWSGDGIKELYSEYFLRTYGVVASYKEWPYTDIPYLDPKIDGEKIRKYLTNENFIDFGDLIIFALAVYLMLQFMSYVPILAGIIKGATKESSAGIMAPGAQLTKTFTSAVIGSEGSGKRMKRDKKEAGGGKIGMRRFSIGGRDMGLAGSALRGMGELSKIAGIKDTKGMFNKLSAKEKQEAKDEKKKAGGSNITADRLSGGTNTNFSTSITEASASVTDNRSRSQIRADKALEREQARKDALREAQEASAQEKERALRDAEEAKEDRVMAARESIANKLFEKSKEGKEARKAEKKAAKEARRLEKSQKAGRYANKGDSSYKKAYKDQKKDNRLKILEEAKSRIDKKLQKDSDRTRKLYNKEINALKSKVRGTSDQSLKEQYRQSIAKLEKERDETINRMSLDVGVKADMLRNEIEGLRASGVGKDIIDNAERVLADKETAEKTAIEEQRAIEVEQRQAQQEAERQAKQEAERQAAEKAAAEQKAAFEEDARAAKAAAEEKAAQDKARAEQAKDAKEKAEADKKAAAQKAYEDTLAALQSQLAKHEPGSDQYRSIEAQIARLEPPK
ncbi:type IV secretion system protein [Rickettsiales bacterium]|nr:type IV secretion system protein [Rickettsiales bacterium]